MTGDKEPRLAEWAREAMDFSANPSRADGLMSIGQVSDAINLSKTTIRDSLTRKEVDRADNPRAAICRPYARIGDIPMWSADQVVDYKRRDSLRKGRALGEALPPISADEARERGLVTTKEICELLGGLHDQTLRRYQRDDDTYPPAVARRTRSGQPGVPEHVRSLAEVMAWAAGKESLAHLVAGDVEIPQQSTATVEREDVTS